MLRNQNWYNLQETRNYPIDDLSTTRDDGGTPLPANILVDCHIRFPSLLGDYLYIGGATVTENLVSVVILGYVDGEFVPAAALTVVKPVRESYHYPVSALYPGVGGFIVLGGGVREEYAGRFSTTQQARLVTKCCRPYGKLPIPTLRKLGNATGLSGLVRILPGNDMEIVKETVDGVGEALVFRLAPGSGDRNVLQQYIGPCNVRPESRNCRREGIESINETVPDCAGNINILFVGLTAGEFQDCGSLAAGTTLDHSIGIDEICEDRNPDKWVGEDYCLSSQAADSVADDEEEGDEAGSVSSVSLSATPDPAVVCAELPHCATFTAGLPEGWDVVIGGFETVANDDPEPLCDGDYALQSTYSGRRNVVLCPEVCDDPPALDLAVVADLYITTGGTLRNGQLILNYHSVDLLTNPHVEYYAVTLDANSNKIKLQRWTGIQFVDDQSTTPSQVLLPGHWYRITAEVLTYPADEDLVAIGVEVEDLTNPYWPKVSFSTTVSQYLPADGRFGFGADRSLTAFSFLSLESS